MLKDRRNAMPSQLQEQCAQKIDLLSREIGEAMGAISANSLHALEESLWRQEVICSDLKYLLRTAHENVVLTIAVPLRSPLHALHRINASYAGLLQQTREKNQQLYALIRTYNASPPL
jgi:hypothetical protein